VPKRTDVSDFDAEVEYLDPIYEFEGRGVYATAISMPNAGGGLAVKCPKCWAPKGQRCITHRGTRTKRIHAARVAE